MFYNVAQVIERCRWATDQLNFDDKAKDHVYWCIEMIEGAVKACEIEILAKQESQPNNRFPTGGSPVRW